MIRFFILLFLFCMCAFADLRIVSIKQLQNGIILEFNQNIQAQHFKSFTLHGEDNLRYVYDINAQLSGTARVFDFQNDVNLKIAQNSAQKVRLVITTSKKLEIHLKTEKKQARFEMPDTKIENNRISIAALFDRDSKKTTPKTQETKKTKEIKESQKTEKKQENKNIPKPKNTDKKDGKQEVQKVDVKSTKGKIVVIDPGHGGHDCGAMGVGRVCEKKIVLEIGKYLRDILNKRGYKVHMTRNSDRFIGLRQRTNFANNKNADLFISIHANAIKENKEKLEGIESYFLSTARSERAKKVAALENKDATEDMNYFSKQSFLNTLNTQRIIASNRLAIDIQFGMLQSLRNKYQNIIDGGVREGPFWVLVGAVMPSVLLEVGYITHPREGKRINQASYQKSIAQGVADGVDGYFQKNP